MEIYKTRIMTKKILLVALFILAFSERVFFDLGPNTELVTLAMLISAAYFGTRTSVVITLAIMVLSDLVIGNTNILIFTWSGFLIPAFILGRVFKTFKLSGLKKVGLGTLTGVGANLFFYLWTNFGVWLLGNMYPKTLIGLSISYINALPFLKMQLIGTLIFVPLGFAVLEALYSFKKSPNFEKFVLGIR